MPDYSSSERMSEAADLAAADRGSGSVHGRRYAEMARRLWYVLLHASVWSRFLAMAVLAMAVPLTAIAQQDSITSGVTPPLMAPGAPAGSYALSGLESISLSNGHLSFRLPLLMPGARSEAKPAFLFPIEQNWRITFALVNDQDHPNCTVGSTDPNCYSYYATANWWNPRPVRYGEATLVSRGAGRDSISGCGFSPAPYQNTLRRLTFTAPDGTEHELLDAATGGAEYTQNCNQQVHSRGQWFSSFDGAGATFYADDSNQVMDPYSVGGGGPDYPSGNLYTADGARYRVDIGNVTSWRDRNGNLVTYTWDTAT